MFEGKVIYDQSFGHVSYGCAACCATGTIQLQYDPFGIGVSFQGLNQVQGLNSCTNGWTDINQDFPNWKTANAAIATTTNVGLHTGMSAGGTTSSTYGFVVKTNGRNGCYEVQNVPASGPTNVGVPTSMLFYSDLTTKSSACTVASQNATERIIQYQVISQTGSQVGSVPMQESFANLTSDTCSNPAPNPTACNSTGVSAEGIFSDFISTNACSPPNAGTCGFSLNPDLWQYCKSGSPAVTIGKPVYGVLWQAVYVDGSTAQITPLTPVPK